MIWEKLVSNTVKEHWKKVSFEPSEALKAAIIYNSPLKEGEKAEAYRELLQDMKDEGLKDEIRQVMDCREKAYRKFIEESDGYVYQLIIYERPEHKDKFEFGMYARQEYAYQFAMAYIKEFNLEGDFVIQKTKICDYEIKDTDDYACRSEEVIYTYDGSARRYYLEDGVPDYDEDNLRFCDKYYEIPHPFKRGDIVKMMPEYVDIEESLEKAEKEYYFVIDTIHAPCQNEETGEYGDIGIKIEEFNANTGRFYEVDAATNHIKLEYAGFDRSKVQFDDPAYMAMYFMSSILEGKEEYVSLQTVQDACRCLRERHEEENKIKCFMARFDVRIPYYEWYHT